ncbi:histidine phosphatase family protein [Collimonas pratensis]|uniref:Histidine phosphatase super family protein n=1 Tax=Collimonas pratensis TaxID=279113 RepID=A0ABM5ZCM4_9BURK|nr:histidine phosphatase family protein [Collimonas pratensis]AMP16961.1 histidine phosphatase super family protein [Collimonas pratensis]
MATTEILLIRHGETDWNLERRLQGHLDIPLNQVGQRQALALARSLDGVAIDAIFSSDLQRARQTAAPLAAARKLSLQLDAGLRERCYGALEGLRYPEAAERFPEAYAALMERAVDYRYPAGVHAAESMREFYERAVHALLAILSAGNPARIAIVTHGGVLDCIYRCANQLPLEQPRSCDIFNASINRLSWNPDWAQPLRVDGWADVAHLDELTLDEIDR